jgi:hypothetical protein
MADIILKIIGDEVTVSNTAVTVSDSVLFRIYAPATAKIYTTDEANTAIGSMTIPGGLVETMEKRKTDRIRAVPNVLCTPVAYK